MSVVENVEKLILEVERRPPLNKKQSKEYSDKHLKDKLWSEVCEAVVMNWSELPAEQKSEKVMLTFFVTPTVCALPKLLHCNHTLGKETEDRSNP
jgi:hypothetical protein